MMAYGLAFLLAGGAAAAAWLWLARRKARWPARAAAVGLVTAVALASAAAFSARARRQQAARELAAIVPAEGRPGGYVTSRACEDCHPAEHASWHRSYHRTMTQRPAPATVLAPWDGPALPVKQGQLLLTRRDDAYWVRLQPAEQSAPARDFRVGLLTGSHHMQLYWVNGEVAPPPGARPTDVGNRLEMFPYAYLIADRRWVPARDTFLADPELQWRFDVWNTQCLQCHVTAGQPRLRPDGRGLDSRVGEIGIGCESCHGPGQAHVDRMQDPPTGRSGGRRAELAIVNPARLPPRASSQVCGQCHGYFAVTDLAAFSREGFTYRPGDELEATKPTLHPDRPQAAKYLAAARAEDPRFEASLYWSDGGVRVTGREWTALQRSACHRRGGITCLSCHAMHRSDPDDQLAAGRAGNDACLGCHAQLRPRIESHTHHAPGSPGSLCYNCHMPYTTYGLLKAVRSHDIDSPRVATSAQTGRPDACNLCHLDRSLQWAAERLRDWYGQPLPDLPEPARALAAGVTWAVAGDAGQRALMAWSMGWDAARSASGDAWMTPYLLLALSDPYSAVRYIAQRSLRKRPGLQDVAYDYVAPPEAIERSVQAMLARWAPLRQPEPDPARAGRLLLRPDGALATSRVEELLGRRDDRPLELRE